MKNHLKDLLRRENLFVLILAGILIFIISLPTGREQGKSKEPKEEMDEEKESHEKDYATSLEERLEALLWQMDGVGRTKVMITLKTSEELVVEKDNARSYSHTSEEDSAGGNREITQTQSSPNTIFITEAGESSPYVVKTIFPKVEGVVVAAEGAGSGMIDKNITDLIQTLFGIEAHKVRVVKMESSN